MAKINSIPSYPYATPAGDDYLIGTDADSTSPALQTKNFKISDVIALVPPHVDNTLQEVLTAGNTATESINLTGNIALTGNMTGSGDITRTGNITLTGNIALTGNLTGSGDITRTGDITLTGNLTSTGIATINTNIYVDATHPHGSNNLSYGLDSLAQAGLLVGSSNTALGIEALKSLTTGSQNIAVGLNSLRLNSTATNNVVIGVESMSTVTGTPDSNVAVGWYAANGASAASSHNVVVGAEAGSTLAGDDNVIIGRRAGQVAVKENTIIGTRACPTGNWTDDGTTAIGYTSLGSLTDGRANVAVGSKSGTTVVTGKRNTLIGTSADTSAADTDYGTAIGEDTQVTTNAVALGRGAEALIEGSVSFSGAVGAKYADTALLQAPNNAGAQLIDVPIGGLYVVGTTGGAAADPAILAIRTS